MNKLKQELKELLEHDFSKEIEKRDDGTYKLETNQKLFSASSINEFFKPFKKEFINPNDLIKNVIFGKMVHFGVQTKKSIDINDVKNCDDYFFLEINEEELKEFVNEINIAINECSKVLKQNKVKILVCEKMLINQNLYGFIDIIGRSTTINQTPLLIDIKTSSSNKIKEEWLIQLAIYSILTRDLIRNCFILLYNKKTKKADLIQIETTKIREIKQAIKQIFKTYWKEEFK